MKKIAILAGNMEQYMQHKDIFHVAAVEKMFYVNKLENAYGNRFDEYRVVGTFYKRKDASKLEDIVKSRTNHENQPH